MIHQKTADISDAVGQLIAAPAVFTARLHSFVFFGDAVGFALLVFDIGFGAFENQCAGDHFFRLETFYFGHEKLFDITFQNF